MGRALRRGRTLVALLCLATLVGCASVPPGEPSPLAHAPAAPAIDELRMMLAEGRAGEARDRLMVLLAAAPGDAEAWYLLGEAELTLGNADAALQHFARVAASPVFKAVALQGTGLALLQLGQDADALVKLGEATAVDPGLWRAFNAAGYIHDRQKNWPAAEAAYRAAAAARPDLAIVHYNLGHSYLLQGRTEPAIAAFSHALELDPGFAAARRNLRFAYALTGDYRRALDGVPEPELPDALNNAGYAAMLRGDYETAEEYLNEALERSPAYHHEAAANLERLRQLRPDAVETVKLTIR